MPRTSGGGVRSGAGGRGGHGLLRQIQALYPSNYTNVRSAKYVGRDNRGLPIYRIEVVTTYRGRTTTRLQYRTFSDGKLGTPEQIDRSRGSGVREQGGGVRQNSEALNAAKQQWFNTIANSKHSALQKSNLVKAVENWNGTSEGLNQRMAQLFKPAHGPVTAIIDGGTVEEEFPFAFDFGGGGGGFGGGGGGLGPQYRAPDKRVVEDMAKGMLTSLVGTIPEHLVDGLVATYMKDHRRNFDSLDAEIDPAQSMLEQIRQTEDYQVLHSLRPDSEDERSWVANRRAAAAQGGLQTDLREDFAITQATVGGDEPDVAQAASVAQFEQSGETRGTLIDNQLRSVIDSMFGNVI